MRTDAFGTPTRELNMYRALYTVVRCNAVYNNRVSGTPRFLHAMECSNVSVCPMLLL